MLDIQLLRSSPAFVAERLATRGVTLDTAAFEALESERKDLQVRTQDLQARRNSLSKQVGMLKGKGEDASAVLAEVAGIGDELKRNEDALAALQERYNAFVAVIPNLPHESVPIGSDETGIPAYLADDPLSCVALGAGKALDSLGKLQDSLSTLQKNSVTER